MRPLLSICLASLLVACSGNTPPPHPQPPPEPVATAVAILTAAPAPTAAPSGPAPEPDLPSPFFPRVIHGQSTLAYFPLENGGVVIDSYLGVPIRVDDKGARFEPALYTGLKGREGDNAFMVYSVSGDWPNRGQLGLNLPGERGGTDVNYTWNGASWVKAPAQPLGDMPAEVVRAYYDGGLMGHASWGGRPLYYLSGGEDGTRATFVLGGKGKKGPVPAFTRGTGECPTRLVGYIELANLPSGELLGAGKLCTRKSDYQYMGQSGPGALAVERWARGAPTAVVEVLPGTERRGQLGHHGGGFVQTSATDLYVYTTFGSGDDGSVPSVPYVAHHDGKTWTEVSPPSKQQLRELWADKDGALWVRLSSEIWRRRGGAWEKMTPDAEGEIAWTARAPDATLWARVGDELWHLGAAGAWEKAILPRDDSRARFVADRVFWQKGALLIVARSSSNGESALFGSVKPDTVLDLAVDEQGAAAKAPPAATAFGHVAPPTAGCKSLFVVLYKLSRVAPADYDFPVTRDALKGHTELDGVRFAETEDGGTRYLVAFVPSLARGQRLLEVVRAKVQGARPQMLCGEPPKTNRTLKINLRTGALEK